MLCDTNGGSLPDDVGRAVADVRARTSAQIGIHCHNDAGCAVANSLVAVQAGATQVQGCINGYGERAGNTDLSAAIPNLSLKLNIRTIPADRLERLTPVAHHIAELVNIAPNAQQPYVGNSVFAHKGGCTPAPWPAAPTSTSTSSPTRSATAPGSWSPRWRGGPPWP